MGLTQADPNNMHKQNKTQYTFKVWLIGLGKWACKTSVVPDLMWHVDHAAYNIKQDFICKAAWSHLGSATDGDKLLVYNESGSNTSITGMVAITW